MGVDAGVVEGVIGNCVSFTAWNCRGLSDSEPYIQSFLEGGTVLTEHWLWPFELDRLTKIDSNFEAIGKADARLTETSEGRRGCGIGTGVFVPLPLVIKILTISAVFTLTVAKVMTVSCL